VTRCIQGVVTLVGIYLAVNWGVAFRWSVWCSRPVKASALRWFHAVTTGWAKGVAFMWACG
jgi:hypothetical protein